jgi:hypothetical protein
MPGRGLPCGLLVDNLARRNSGCPSVSRNVLYLFRTVKRLFAAELRAPSFFGWICRGLAVSGALA